MIFLKGGVSAAQGRTGSAAVISAGGRLVEASGGAPSQFERQGDVFICHECWLVTSRVNSLRCESETAWERKEGQRELPVLEPTLPDRCEICTERVGSGRVADLSSNLASNCDKTLDCFTALGNKQSPQFYPPRSRSIDQTNIGK